MVFIWGSKGYHDRLGFVYWECPQCGTRGPFSVEQARKKFTLYFVPTFNYSNKQYLVCTACQAAFEVPKELKATVAQRIISQEQLAAAIRQSNASLTEPSAPIPVQSANTAGPPKLPAATHPFDPKCMRCRGEFSVEQMVPLITSHDAESAVRAWNELIEKGSLCLACQHELAEAYATATAAGTEKILRSMQTEDL